VKLSQGFSVGGSIARVRGTREVITGFFRCRVF